MRAVAKSFPGVRALAGVDLRLRSGEVLALVGENGAGKSTLIKMLGGAHQPDAGEILVDGEAVRFRAPNDAIARGLAVIYQEFNLVPELSVRDNLFLGKERSLGWIAGRRERERASRTLGALGVELPLDRLCRELSVAQQQIVEIAKALSDDVRLIVMDEPSAALTPNEVRQLLAIVRSLKQRGIGVIYISHRLEEIFEIADRVVVLRDGRSVADAPIGEVSRKQIIEWMVGRPMDQEFPTRRPRIGAARLEVRSLRRGAAVRGVSFEIRAGEILGLTGLVGAGRTETARLIFGADRADAGEIVLDGVPLTVREPRDAIRSGVCLLTEDRKGEGLILGASLRENFGLPNLSEFSQFGFVRRRAEADSLLAFCNQLNIRTPDINQIAAALSGGNQQKVVLAKWLQRDAQVLLFDEPTRGVDVGAKFEIHSLIQAMADQGKAILLISSELPEVLGMCDRILVMHEGEIAGEILDPSQSSQQEIMRYAVARRSKR